MFEWLAGVDEDLGKFVYRGVHGEHPAWKLAIEGTVVPGDIDGLITAEEHNAGGVADRSPFTSWTHKPRVAAFYAGLRGPGELCFEFASTRLLQGRAGRGSGLQIYLRRAKFCSEAYERESWYSAMRTWKRELADRLESAEASESVSVARFVLADPDMRLVSGHSHMVRASEALTLWKARFGVSTAITHKPIDGAKLLIDRLGILDPDAELEQFPLTGSQRAGSLFFEAGDGGFVGAVVVDRMEAEVQAAA